jgi:hexosaminidase
VTVATTGGCFQFPDRFRLATDDRTGSEATLLVAALQARGYQATDTGPATVTLEIEADGAAVAQEGYHLSVRRDGIHIRSAAKHGLFHGVQSLLQLLPAHAGESCTLPCVEIADAPRFRWRGMHLDVGRHFMSKAFIFRFLDLMARYKFNVFHWHLTEDQGWRIEIKRYPQLTEIGAWRMENGQRQGGYYTQDDVREIVSYAADRFITVVPEIEIPGHSMAALAAYPELSCTGGPFEVATTWGIKPDVYCAGNDRLFTFMEDVWSELFDLFPGPYAHIGGDECPKERWQACPKCQERIHLEGLRDEHGLQSYVIRRMEAFLRAHGRTLIGWDEILEGGLAPNSTVMSWRGMEGGIAAARAGHDVIMTPNSHCYFDMHQYHDPSLPRDFRWCTDLPYVYSFEPVPPGLTATEERHILGPQGCVWTEYMETSARVEFQMLPRMCALAEVAWTPQALRNWDDFHARLQAHYDWFEANGLKHHRYAP